MLVIRAHDQNILPPPPPPPPFSFKNAVVRREERRQLGEMVDRFFSCGAKRIDSCSEVPSNITLLSGPPSCGKTSLLLQFAYNCASKSSSCNRSVVFICNRRRLETNPPCLSQGIKLSSNVFQRIQMKYVDDDEGVKKYFAAFHLHDTFPAAVVIDDFGDLFDERSCQERYANPRGRDLAMIRTLALCQNAVMHAKKSFGGDCEVLLADTHHGDSPRLLYIYKRWVTSIYMIKGDGRGSFLLKDGRSSVSDDSKKVVTAKYSTALQYLHLEEIAEDSPDQLHSCGQSSAYSHMS